MQIGTCKLCLKEKHLLKRSHIITDFIYRDGKIYHTDHSIHKVDLTQVFRGKFTKAGIQRSGEYEENILCQNCDSIIIKQYEDYAKKILYGKKLRLNERLLYTFTPDEVIIKNIDYPKLKLFFLSILWRSAISSRRFFKEITIEEKKLEELRRMILYKDPKGNLDYPIIFMLDIGKDNTLKQYMGQPISGKDKKSFLFIFPGMLVNYFFDTSLIPKFFMKYRIQSAGEIIFKKLSSKDIEKSFEYLYR